MASVGPAGNCARQLRLLVGKKAAPGIFLCIIPLDGGYTEKPCQSLGQLSMQILAKIAAMGDVYAAAVVEVGAQERRMQAIGRCR